MDNEIENSCNMSNAEIIKELESIDLDATYTKEKNNKYQR